MALRLQALDQQCRVDLQSSGDTKDIVERQVGLAPLDVADVGAVEPAALGETLLGNAMAEPRPQRQPEGPHASPELDLRCLAPTRRHLRSLEAGRTIGVDSQWLASVRGARAGLDERTNFRRWTAPESAASSGQGEPPHGRPPQHRRVFQGDQPCPTSSRGGGQVMPACECGTKFEDGQRFCGSCGTARPQIPPAEGDPPTGPRAAPGPAEPKAPRPPAKNPLWGRKSKIAASLFAAGAIGLWAFGTNYEQNQYTAVVNDGRTLTDDTLSDGTNYYFPGATQEEVDACTAEVLTWAELYVQNGRDWDAIHARYATGGALAFMAEVIEEYTTTLTIGQRTFNDIQDFCYSGLSNPNANPYGGDFLQIGNSMAQEYQACLDGRPSFAATYCDPNLFYQD